MKAKDLELSRKVTAIAPSNIAFIKYWGKANKLLNIPQNSSLSVNFDNLYTTTTVEFSEKFKEDTFTLLPVIAQPQTLSPVIARPRSGEAIFKADRHFVDPGPTPRDDERVFRHLNIVRSIAKTNVKAKVVSVNNFPTGSGLASSASGFAALTLAATSALNLKPTKKELTAIARLGSGSAARSIPDGFVKWEKGTNHKNSCARSLYPKTYWDLQMIAVILSDAQKKVGSTEGHSTATTSPIYKTRIENMPGKIKKLEKALKDKDFPTFGQIVEEEALEMHSIMLTSTPPLVYFLPESIQIIRLCHQMRGSGTEVYFTFDAGPQPVLFCLKKDTKKILTKLEEVKTIKKIVVSSPGDGARLVDKHLF